MIFHNCDTFAYSHQFSRYTIYRQRYSSPLLRAFLTNPDITLSQPETKVLKNGNTSTVWLTSVGDYKLVVKRYNIKGTLHAAKRALRRSRAAISWKNAHRLEYYGIGTGPPVALIEERFGPFRKRAYFISEWVEGEDCIHFFAVNRANPHKEAKAIQTITDLLAKFAELKISHGDMKGTNIILTANGFAVIDLDSLLEHRTHFGFMRRFRRDVRRFMENWQGQPRIYNLFQKALYDRGLSQKHL